MAKAADWLRQERRKVLGDWVAFCLGCGAARRWFEEFEAEVPETCSQSTTASEENGAPHPLQRRSSSPPH